MISKKQRRKRKGVVTVEAALVFSLLLLLTLGIIEYGWLFLKTEEATNAARRGVRLAVKPDVTSEEVLTAVDGFMASSNLGDSGYQVAVTPSDVSAAGVGDIVTVSITLPYSNVSITGAPLVPTPQNVEASVSMAKEGP
jgi:Flp pilus assembly protein TadG